MPLRRALIGVVLTAVLLATGGTVARAQQLVRERVPSADVASVRKSESTARRWSMFVPGSGHIYAGETGKGVALLTAATLGTSLFVLSLPHDEGCDYDVCSAREAIPAGLLLGAATAIGAWTYGLIDSRRAVRRHNERLGLGARPRVTPYVAASTTRTRVGLSIVR